MRTKITGIRQYFPEKRLTNADLEKMVETNDQWIVERTGIKERRIGEAHETPSYMGTKSAEALLKDFDIDPKTIDLILVGTATPDYLFPATACLIQNNIGATNAFGFDISAACSGYLFALDTARAFIESGRSKRVLLIAAEKMSAIMDYKDRSTCILFGDGGSATLLEPGNDESHIIDSISRIDGSGAFSLIMPAGGSAKPASHETIEAREHFIQQDGKNVFKRAVKDMADISTEILEKNNFKGSDVKLFVPHQANLRIIQAAARRMDLKDEQVAINIDRYGNTTAATIPTALYEAEQKGQVKKGDLVLLASFGAGYTWGSTLLKL